MAVEEEHLAPHEDPRAVGVGQCEQQLQVGLFAAVVSDRHGVLLSLFEDRRRAEPLLEALLLLPVIQRQLRR